MKKLIIDADPGTDDFIAISLALKSKMFDVIGITSVEGNCDLESATKNCFKVLNMCNRDDIEVYKGLNNNFLGTKSASDVHGNNGLGGIYYEPINRTENKSNAIDFLVKTINDNPNEVTIAALGPLTNIAECIKKDKTFASKVKELIIMGGSDSLGNITQYAEFNFYKDPKSVETVLKANFKSILIFGWNYTTKLTLTNQYEEILKNSDKELPRFIYSITRKTVEHDKPIFGGAVISDPITIAHLIDNSIANMKPVKINIIVEGENAGESEVEYVDNSNIKFACLNDGDKEKFYNTLFKYII